MQKYIFINQLMTSYPRYNYDRKMSELYSADDDHPLKSTDFSFSNLSVTEDSADKINSELQSVAVDWKPLRSTTVCACSTPFDQIVRKVGTVLFETKRNSPSIFVLFSRTIVAGVEMCFVRGALTVRLLYPAMLAVYRFQFVERVTGLFRIVLKSALQLKHTPPVCQTKDTIIVNNNNATPPLTKLLEKMLLFNLTAPTPIHNFVSCRRLYFCSRISAPWKFNNFVIN